MLNQSTDGIHKDDQQQFLNLVGKLFENDIESFNYQFIPIDQSHHQFVCDKCTNFLQKHILIMPCSHTVCQRCVLAHQWDQITCPVCDAIILDMQFNEQLCRQQLQTPVYCCNLVAKEVEVAQYGKQEYDLGARHAALVPVLSDFNANLCKVEQVNYLRQERRFEILRDGAQDLRHYQLQLFEYFPEQERKFLFSCGWAGPYADLAGHIANDCSHTLVECGYCAFPVARQVLEYHRKVCCLQNQRCLLCYRPVQLAKMCHHQVGCLQTLLSYDTAKLVIPVEYSYDLELESLVTRIQQGISNLQNLVLRLDTNSQGEVIQYQNSEKVRLKSNIQNKPFFHYIYEKHVLLFQVIVILLFYLCLL
ncbi:hypothetical protein SS50377_20918 [Spironucleus salmonicida]|uniref:RING-type domain-containing protein n=1 Tax=Spironucleus salmonicida TaxID=348837 RepID=A0A9P8S1S4_9EUKA|nr:hypothetical protein SS50377_20918 [Spironucleus salmonicida]